MNALGQHQRRVRMAEVVEANRRQLLLPQLASPAGRQACPGSSASHHHDQPPNRARANRQRESPAAPPERCVAAPRTASRRRVAGRSVAIVRSSAARTPTPTGLVATNAALAPPLAPRRGRPSARQGSRPGASRSQPPPPPAVQHATQQPQPTAVRSVVDRQRSAAVAADAGAVRPPPGSPQAAASALPARTPASTPDADSAPSPRTNRLLLADRRATGCTAAADRVVAPPRASDRPARARRADAAAPRTPRTSPHVHAPGHAPANQPDTPAPTNRRRSRPESGWRRLSSPPPHLALNTPNIQSSSRLPAVTATAARALGEPYA